MALELPKYAYRMFLAMKYTSIVLKCSKISISAFLYKYNFFAI